MFLRVSAEKNENRVLSLRSHKILRIHETTRRRAAHSNNSLARPDNGSGTEMPNALAVFRLM